MVYCWAVYFSPICLVSLSVFQFPSDKGWKMTPPDRQMEVWRRMASSGHRETKRQKSRTHSRTLRMSPVWQRHGLKKANRIRDWDSRFSSRHDQKKDRKQNKTIHSMSFCLCLHILTWKCNVSSSVLCSRLSPQVLCLDYFPFFYPIPSPLFRQDRFLRYITLYLYNVSKVLRVRACTIWYFSSPGKMI